MLKLFSISARKLKSVLLKRRLKADNIIKMFDQKILIQIDNYKEIKIIKNYAKSKQNRTKENITNERPRKTTNPKINR